MTKKRTKSKFRSVSASGKSGFLLMELLLGLAIISLLILPLSMFIVSHSDMDDFLLPDQIAINNNENTIDGDDKDVDIFKADYINSRASAKSCDLFFSNAMSRGEADNNSQLVIKTFKKHEINLLGHGRNIPTSINVRRDNKDTYLLLGANSASTTDADFYVFKHEDETTQQQGVFSSSSVKLVQEIFLGPGTIDSILHRGKLFIAERSRLTPLWLSRWREATSGVEVFSGGDRVGENTFLAQPTAISSSTIKHAFPKIIKYDGTELYIGSEKNIHEEFYVLKHSNNNQSGVDFTRQYSVELGAGINDIDFNDKAIFIASPKDPEIEYILKPEVQTSIPSSSPSSSTVITGLVTKSGSYDAEGSSGNGKSLFAQFNNLILGRTLGNRELMFLNFSRSKAVKGIQDMQSIQAQQRSFELMLTQSIDVNKSIIFTQLILAGQYTLLITNDPETSILLFENEVNKNKDDVSKEILRIPTTGVIADYDCSQNALYAIQKSTSTSLLYLTY